MVLGKGKNSEGDVEAARAAAATLIQRMWRGRANKAKQDYMTTETRWDDAANKARFEVNRSAALNGRNTPMERWRRAAFFVGQLAKSDKFLGAQDIDVAAEDKHLETQHWLELIDGKHRYGSNLKWYHKKWQEDDTKENFFKWLDRGGGKDISLDQCPRERLESERILYLSAEQRLNYLVKVNSEGKLYWAKNNQLVDTTAGDWKDAGGGRGIIPEGLPTKPVSPLFGMGTESKSLPPLPGAPQRSSKSSSEEQINSGTHYAGPPKGKYTWSRYLRERFTPRGMMQRLLRKTVKRNTWIYVSDKNFNIFIGIKETGVFQHSSFTSGGLVTSAGLISVKQGVIYTLSPLSGHYRTTINHFHKFIDVLTESGVDMHKVRISKAEAALWGVEQLTKIKKSKKRAATVGKVNLAKGILRHKDASANQKSE